MLTPMAKRCCPCPLDAARAKVRAAKTCNEANQAADAFVEAAGEELATRPEGVAKDRYSRLLDAEFDRVTQKASVRCTYPSKSDKAVRAITKARTDIRRTVAAAKKANERARAEAERLIASTRKQSEAAVRKAIAAQAAATQLQGLRRRRSLSPF